MRLIKLGLISILVFLLLITGISLLFPSYQRVSRAINIAAPIKKVQQTVADLHTWEGWNKFTNESGLTHMQISMPSSGEGAFLSSDQLELSVLQSSADSMRMNWNQIKGRSFEGGFNFLQLSPDSLTVQWWFDFHFRWYPWEKFGSLVYDRQLGPIMEESLSGLKRYVENSP
jgi:hypothetical protein